MSRRNLEDNVACVRRQGENRFWYEEIVDTDRERALENGTQELKRSIDKTIAAVSAQIKVWHLRIHALHPLGTLTRSAAVRNSGL
jgi:hypothetical protein